MEFQRNWKTNAHFITLSELQDKPMNDKHLKGKGGQKKK